MNNIVSVLVEHYIGLSTHLQWWFGCFLDDPNDHDVRAGVIRDMEDLGWKTRFEDDVMRWHNERQMVSGLTLEQAVECELERSEA